MVPLDWMPGTVWVCANRPFCSTDVFQRLRFKILMNENEEKEGKSWKNNLPNKMQNANPANH